MWPFAKQSARRKEIRRSRAERGLGWFPRLAGRAVLARHTITVASGILAAVIVNLGDDALDIRVGQNLPRAITSRVEFYVENMDRTSEMRGRARDTAPVYYRPDESLLQDIRRRLAQALQLAKEHAADPDRLQQEARKSKLALDEAGRAELLRLAGLSDSEEYQKAADAFQAAVDAAVTKLATKPPWLVESVGPAQRRNAVNAVLIAPREPIKEFTPQQRMVPMSKLPAAGRPTVETLAENAAESFAPPLRPSIKTSIVAMLSGGRPDLSRSTSARRRQGQNRAEVQLQPVAVEKRRHGRRVLFQERRFQSRRGTLSRGDEVERRQCGSLAAAR